MEYSAYYETKLYPVQDAVLKTLETLELPFYLTGGTALSRGYYNHRYSDDLDLFVNNDKHFLQNTENAINKLKKSEFYVETEAMSNSHVRIKINSGIDGLNKKGLKIDLSSYRNAIIAANKKRGEYASAKEEIEQMQKLGIQG